jgi:hypothetical protein
MADTFPVFAFVRAKHAALHHEKSTGKTAISGNML